MNCKFLFLIITFIFVLPLNDVYACTSFAVYSNQIYYGMNFDFAMLPMKFLISVNGDIRTFHLAFERTFGEMKFFVNTAGMNDKGLFSSCQEMHPVNEHPREKTDANMFTFELYEKIASCRSAEEILKISQDFPLIDMPGITVHNLFADTTGRAFVTEADDSETAIIDGNDNFMVMTNFQNNSIIGKNYQEAKGKGADRYIICHDYLQQNASDLTIEKGLELLSMCRNKDPEYPTSCSMIFDPHEGEVYIVLEKDFSKVLRLSIKKGMIETFKGYAKYIQLPLPAGNEGLLLNDLKHLLQ